jgi:transposase InsO family protein
VRTTISDKAVPCPLDHVNRQFHALRPNALWVSDFTYVATAKRTLEATWPRGRA